MPALNVGVNSTFEQQRQIVNAIAVDVFTLSTTLSGLTTDGLVVTYSSVAGVATYASVAGIATYATISGISSYAVTSGVATVANYASVAGVASALNFVPNYAHNAGVASYATVAGIATNANFATSSSSSTFAFYAGISTYSGSAGIATVAQGLTGIPNVRVGVITASLFVGDGSELTGLNLGIVTFATNAGFASTAGFVSYTPVAGFATVAGSTPLASYAPVAGFATVAGNLTGTPNLNVGIITATKFAADDAEFTGILTAQSLKSSSGYILAPDNIQSIQLFSSSGEVGFSTWIRTFGIRNYSGSNVVNIAGTDLVLANKIFGDGSSLSGVVTSLVAGTNVSITNTGGVYTISAAGGGGGSGDSYWGSTSVGIGTTQKVGIGTTAPTEFLTVRGNASIIGNIILTGEISSPTRIKFGSGGENIKIGDLTGGFGAANIAIGDQALVTNNGGTGHNIGIGQLSLFAVTSGQYNIALGDRAGQNLTTGSNNVIIGGYNGQTGLDIRTSSNNVVLSDGAGNIRQYINSSGNVGIKTTIVTEALTVAGVVSATSFYGTLNASQLTGTLPAIDGSALIGVVGSGSGVIVQDDATPIGTAGTINFGSNLSVSFASGIATVIASIPGINTSGTSTFNQLDATQLNVSGITTFQNNVNFGDNDRLRLGDSQDLQIYHNGSNSFIRDQGLGSLLIQGSGVFLQDPAGNPYVECVEGGGIYLAFDGSITLQTTGVGVTVTGTTFTNQLSISGNTNSAGIITASSFSGSGSGLTNLPAGQLTGSLPAIDGSQLLNVTASGTGIVVKDDNVNVGSAVTVNFGTGLDVTFSSGIATISSSGGSLQSRITVSGVTTSIPNLGIGNTDITGFKSYSLMRVGLSTAGWIRLYTDSTSRANDVTRSVGEDPAPGSGVIAEVVTTGISTQQMITSFVMGGNMDNPVTDKIYVAITNLSGTTQTITANLTILQLEA